LLETRNGGLQPGRVAQNDFGRNFDGKAVYMSPGHLLRRFNNLVLILTGQIVVKRESY
jgi:hypothetical protein